MMHPAAQRAVERILGVEWSVQLQDFNHTVGISGRTSDGKRAAVRMTLDEQVTSVLAVYAKHPELIAEGKKAVLEQLKRR